MAFRHSSIQDLSGLKIYCSMGNIPRDTNRLNDIVARSMNNSATNFRDGRRHRAIEERTNGVTERTHHIKERTDEIKERTDEIRVRTKGPCSRKMIIGAMLGVVLLWAVSAGSGVLVYHVIKSQQATPTTPDETNIAVSHLTAEMDELKKTVHILKTRKGGKVAFTVNMPTDMLAADDVPTFKNIILNTGEGYNVSSGRFRCPVPGLYLFTVTLVTFTSSEHSTFCTLFKNTVKITAVYKERKTLDSVSNTVFLALSRGNEVYLSCHNVQHTLFSGALVNAD